MNNTAYVFGDFGFGHTQYPDDNLKTVFMTAKDSCISVRRDGSMSWCIYRRKFSETRFIGLAVGFNGVCCTSIKDMFSIFENVITGLALEGKLIGFAENGTLIPLVPDLSSSLPDIEKIIGSLYSSFGSLKSNAFCQLPPINYGAGNTKRVTLSASSASGDIQDALEKVNSVDIMRGERPDPVDSYAEKLKAANKKITSLSSHIDVLKKDLKKMEHQKKRTALITFLMIAIGILFTIFMTVRLNLNDKIAALRYDIRMLEQAVDDKNTQINEQNSTIQDQIGKISKLNDSLFMTRGKLSDEKTANASLMNMNRQMKADIVSLKHDIQNKSAEINSLKTQLTNEKSEKSRLISYYNKQMKTFENQIRELKSSASDGKKRKNKKN